MTSIPFETSDHDSSQKLSLALGQAVVRLWSLLPVDVQQHLFEEATSHGTETRSQLALFLHAKNPRTCVAMKAAAIIEPDSHGG